MNQSAKHERPPTPIVVLLGGPGSGKGTYGKVLAAALGYEHLSSGEHFRDHILRATPLGLRVGEFINQGQLVPDESATELVRTMLGGPSGISGFVLDGYPRSLAQAEALEKIVSDLDRSVTQALYLAVSDDEIVRRLSGRLTCRACGQSFHEFLKPPARPDECDECGGVLFRRDDDEPVTIRRRIAVFHQTIEPLLEFYRKTGRLVEVPAEGSEEKVSARVLAKSNGDLPL